MTREEIVAVQQDIGIPDSWLAQGVTPESHADWLMTLGKSRHYISGPSFQAELKGRIAIEAHEAGAGWITIHTEAGPIMIRSQVLSIDGGEL